MKKTVWVFFIVLLVLRIYLYYDSRPNFRNGTKIRIAAKVVTEPIRYTNSLYIRLQGFKVYIPIYPEVYYGDFVVIEGIVKDSELEKAELIEVRESEGILYATRKRLIDFFMRSLPQPHASLLAGVTIGSKSSIPKDFWEALKRSGTAHVVVASGMNVTLVSQFLISFLTIIIPRRKAIILAMVGIWFYAVLSGFDAPIIRASIMGSLVFVAQELGRLSFSLRTLMVTGILMLFIKPDWISDIGFLLSFAATLSLILFEPKVDKLLIKLPTVVRKDLSTSLAAQVGVVPILFFSFGQFNAFSPIINTLIAWTIVPVTMIGMIGGIIGLITEPVGTLIVWLTYPMTSWFVWIVKIFS